MQGLTQRLPLFVACLVVVLFIAGTVWTSSMTVDSYRATINRTVSAKDDALARGYLSELCARNFKPIKASIDPAFTSSQVKSGLRNAAAALPAGCPDTVDLVSYTWHVTTSGSGWFGQYQLKYGHAQALANIAISWPSGQPQIELLRIQPLGAPLERSNRFFATPKGPGQYLFLFLTIVDGIFVLGSLIACAAMRGIRYRWLWMIAICIGVVQNVMNWSTGVYTINMFSFEFPGFSIGHSSPYAPWYLLLTIPVGAVAFWVFYQQAEVTVAQPVTT